MTKQTENVQADLEVQHYECKRGHPASELMFYKRRDGSPMSMCKQCINEIIDVRDPKTFMWVLEELDRPFIENEWNHTYETTIKQNPRSSNIAFLGKYLAKMRLRGFTNFTYKDSERINFEYKNRADIIHRTTVKDCIIWHIDTDSIELDKAREKHEELQKWFPNSKVITLPDRTYLESLTKDEALKMLDDLKNYIVGQN